MAASTSPAVARAGDTEAQTAAIQRRIADILDFVLRHSGLTTVAPSGAMADSSRDEFVVP